MRKNYIEEKRDTYNLIQSYQAFEHLILLNYSFDEEWVLSYLDRNRHLDISEQISNLNRNENLRVDWKVIYESHRFFITDGAWDVCYNKTACEVFKNEGIPIYFKVYKGEAKLPEGIKFNDTFGIDELREFIDNCDNFDIDEIYRSKDIWNHFFKDLVDEEMIMAWTYKDTLNKEIELHYQSERDNATIDMMGRIYESEMLAQGEYDNNPNVNDDFINDVFGGDSESLWNID